MFRTITVQLSDSCKTEKEGPPHTPVTMEEDSEQFTDSNQTNDFVDDFIKVPENMKVPESSSSPEMIEEPEIPISEQQRDTTSTDTNLGNLERVRVKQ